MKRVLLVLLFAVPTVVSNAQAIRTESFELNPSFVTVAGGGFGFVATGGGSFITGSSSANALPASTSFASAGSVAYAVTNNTATLTSGNIATPAGGFVAFRFRLQAFSVNNSNNGLDITDFVSVDISPNGGTNWWPTLTVTGSDDACWSYAATGSAETGYDGNLIPTVFSPSGNNGIVNTAPSTVVIRNLPTGISSLRIRIRMSNSNANERWVIDNLQLLNTSGGPLPVTFANVSAQLKNNQGIVNWTNLTESDVEHYAVERSVDAKNYEVIGKVAAVGNDFSSHSYTFVDATPNNAVNFYRIKAVEFNGAQKNTIVMKVSSVKAKPGFTIYPNPVQNKVIALQARSIEAGTYAIQLVNSNGQTVFSKSLVLQSGTVSQSIELPAGINPGIYMLKISGRDTQTSTKLFIQ